jgi:Flp pilus assembly protein TadG
VRSRDERGSALVELSWLGILLLVPMLWIVLSVFEVQRGAFAVSSAARSAGRAYALAPNDAVGWSRAETEVRRALDDQGLDGAGFTLRVTCTPFPADCHTGTSTVTVQVSTQVQVPLLPEVLGGDAPSVALDATHSVPVGQYQEVGRASP